jgi:hypothetical protein
MPERENLEVQSRARSSCGPKREDQRHDDGEHESSLFDAERHFNQRTASDVSGRHSAKATVSGNPRMRRLPSNAGKRRTSDHLPGG